MSPGRALSAALILAGCAGTRDIPDPTAKHLEYAEKAGYPATTLRALAYGRRLYVSRCSGCHELYRPGAYPSARWPRIVLDMRSSARIDADQVRDITRYLVAMASAPEAAAEARKPVP